MNDFIQPLAAAQKFMAGRFAKCRNCFREQLYPIMPDSMTLVGSQRNRSF